MAEDINKKRARDRKYNRSEKGKIRHKKYSQSEYGKMQLKKRWRERKLTREKYLSFLATINLRNRGKKSPVCEICGKKTPTAAHHSDYSKPYEVIWLCRDCHDDIHYPNRRDHLPAVGRR